MSVDLAHIRQVRAEADCLFNNDEVEAAIGRVAEAINRDLGETNPVVFCVMNGGLIFSGKLLPLLDFPPRTVLPACDPLPQRDLRRRTVLEGQAGNLLHRP